ncbi:C-C motif chemokine 2 [Labeo rohita]|uniref:C-C motif chemokine 2 n=1 Tax=Labeo rohita TaxID=84645 RepID=A0ABQ8MZA9_LABRO|nr:C-C motif chemokine 2 [Labeo rohita]
MKFILFTAILFSMGWMNIEGSDDGLLGCCLTVSNTRTSVENILINQDYVLSELFQTRKNKVICSDPDDAWAKRVMAIVDSRRTLTHAPSKKPLVFGTENLVQTTTQGLMTTEGKIRQHTLHGKHSNYLNCVCAPGIHHVMGTKCPHKDSNTSKF